MSPRKPQPTAFVTAFDTCAVWAHRHTSSARAIQHFENDKKNRPGKLAMLLFDLVKNAYTF